MGHIVAGGPQQLLGPWVGTVEFRRVALEGQPEDLLAVGRASGALSALHAS